MTLVREGFRPFLSHFADGLLRPSPSSLIGTNLFVVFAILFCTWGISPDFVGSREWGGDTRKVHEYSYLTSRAISIASERSDVVRITAIGASPLRDTVIDSDIIRQAVAKACDRDVQFADLTAGNLSLWEVVAIADHIADNHKGIVLIDVSPHRFARNAADLKKIVDNPRIGIRSKSLDAMIRRKGFRTAPITDIYLVDNLSFVAARRWAIIESLMRTHRTSGDILSRVYEYDLNVKKMGKRVSNLKGELRTYFDEIDDNMELLRFVLRRFSENGDTTVVLLESPFNPLAWHLVFDDEVYGIIWQDYYDKMQTACKEFGAEYWRLDKDAELVESEFMDEFHLANNTARRRFTNVLAGRLSTLMASDLKGQP